MDEGESVQGVTLLSDELYLLRRKGRDQVEVYDIHCYRRQRCLTVQRAGCWLIDMTACEHHHCLYAANSHDKAIHKLDAKSAACTHWEVTDKPTGLSVNSKHNVVVTFPEVGKIKEFTTNGQIIREIQLPGDITGPRHTIELSNGQFVLCHCHGDAKHRVCATSADGRDIISEHGGQKGSETHQCNWPCHMAVDKNEFLFVADCGNLRVTLLSPTLDYVRHVLSSDQLRGPRRLHLDAQRRRLYVADGEHVKVFSV